MKTNKLSIVIALLGLFMLALPACQPEEFKMGEVISKEALKYSITQNAEDPNMIILKSENPGLNPMWVTPMGRSTRVQDTLRIPFEGDYKFVYGVQSAGGFVQADTFMLSLTTNNLNYVNDELWTFLSGGVGKEKTWIFDNGEYGMTPGALSYADPNAVQEFRNYTPNWDPGKLPPGSTDENIGWNSTMTFSLKNGAFFTTVKYNEGGTAENPILESGTYFLNADAKTIDITDANLLRPDNYIANADNWNTGIKILELNENQFRVAIMRTNDEGPWYYILNYVSKEYADAYEPEDQPDPEPELPAGWQDAISTVVSKTINWKLSTKNPLDWANLDGSRMNGWNVPADYPDWLGTPDPSVYEGFSLIMNSDDGTVVYVAPDGTKEEGTFELDEKGVYTFTGIDPSFPIIGWASFGLTADNQLRILSIEKDASGNMSGMWLGARDPDPEKSEYFAFHLVPSIGGGAVDPVEAIRRDIVKALTGSGTRTFKPDRNWFIDWVGDAPDFAGGWTSASIFGDDYTSNLWVWDAAVDAIVQSASLEFSLVGGNVSITVSQTLTTEHQEGEGDAAVWVTDTVDEGFSQSGTVTIDPENLTLDIDIPLVDYAGSASRWLTSEGNEGTWFIVSHGESSLSNVESAGLWLGFTSKEGETTIMHYVVE